MTEGAEAVLLNVESLFLRVLGYCIIFLELVGALVILVAALRAIPTMFKDKHKCRELLTDGIVTGLNFLLASEVLKTLVTPDWKDIGMTCAILVMRAGITILVRWENKSEESTENGKTEKTENHHDKHFSKDESKYYNQM